MWAWRQGTWSEVRERIFSDPTQPPWSKPCSNVRLHSSRTDFSFQYISTPWGWVQMRSPCCQRTLPLCRRKWKLLLLLLRKSEKVKDFLYIRPLCFILCLPVQLKESLKGYGCFGARACDDAHYYCLHSHCTIPSPRHPSLFFVSLGGHKINFHNFSRLSVATGAGILEC